MRQQPRWEAGDPVPNQSPLQPSPFSPSSVIVLLQPPSSLAPSRQQPPCLHFPQNTFFKSKSEYMNDLGFTHRGDQVWSFAEAWKGDCRGSSVGIKPLSWSHGAKGLFLDGLVHAGPGHALGEMPLPYRVSSPELLKMCKPCMSSTTPRRRCSSQGPSVPTPQGVGPRGCLWKDTEASGNAAGSGGFGVGRGGGGRWITFPKPSPNFLGPRSQASES